MRRLFTLRKVFIFATIFLFLSILSASFFLPRKLEFRFLSESGMPNAFLPEITLIFGGDVMLSRKIGEIGEEKKDPAFFFKNIAEVFQSADISFVNLENPVSLRGNRVGSIYSFRAKPEMLEGLTFAGIDIVNLANNHVLDYEKIGLLDSMKYLEERNIQYVGAGEDWPHAHEGKIIEVKGVKIGFLGYTDLLPAFIFSASSTPAVAKMDREEMKANIQRMREKVDVVVVTLHWGEEYKTHRSDAQAEIAHSLIDAGADLVIGHHPHVVEEVEEYKGGVIAYSLGNLIFDQNFSEDTRNGLVLKVVLKGSKIKIAEPLPVAFSSDYVPYFNP